MAEDRPASNRSTAAAVGGVGGAIPVLNIFTPGISAAMLAEEEARTRELMYQNVANLKGPDLAGGEYMNIQYAGDLNPEVYGSPEAAAYQTVAEDPRTREMQMQALQRMQGYADQAADSSEVLGRHHALSDANAVAAQREAGIRNQMAMRGQSGAGLEFVMAQNAAQEAANRAQVGAMSAAQQAALQRMAGTQAAMSGASSVRGMDADVAARNAAIINSFNMQNTADRNRISQANTDLRNQAIQRNLAARQSQNVAMAGIHGQNLERNDRNKMAQFGAALSLAGARNNALGGEADSYSRTFRDALEAGKTGYGNFKDLATMGAAGMGGGAGGSGGGANIGSMISGFGGGK